MSQVKLNRNVSLRGHNVPDLSYFSLNKYCIESKQMKKTVMARAVSLQSVCFSNGPSVGAGKRPFSVMRPTILC